MRMLTCCLSAALFVAAPARAQQTPDTSGPRVGPPIQKIMTASAVSTERLGRIDGVRELPDGRVLVNDGMRRRLLLMDTTLNVQRVVLDSLSEIAHTYGTRAGALVPFRGDTTLFIDPASYAMLMLDPQGNITRVRSVWRVQDVFAYGNTYNGLPGVDGRGRVVYRINASPELPKVAPPPGVPFFPQEPDSAFIVAVDIDTRKQDTLATVRIPRYPQVVRRSGEGYWYVDMANNPLPVSDDWAVLPDGIVAIVRAIDYRIEYLHPDGQWTSSAKLPFEWVRLADEDKQRIVDSVKVALNKSYANNFVTSMIRWVNQYARDYPINFKVPEGYTLPPGLPKDWLLPKGVTFPETYVYACPPGVQPQMPGMPVMVSGAPSPAPGASPPAGGGPATPAQPNCMPAPVMFSSGMVPPMPQPREPSVMAASELPDYRPPLPASASMRADYEGNLWIRTLPPRPVPGGPVYDVVSRAGELVTRMQLPPGYTLVGFGRDKVVYLSMRDATGLHLARVRLK